MLEGYIERWQLRLTGTASAGLPINVIFYAETGQGDPVVLKIGHPHPEQKTEIIALCAYRGRYAVNILDWDEGAGALLMDRVLPGKKLRHVANDIECSRIRIRLIGELPIPLSDVAELPSFGEWMDHAFTEFREKHNGEGEEKQEFLSFIEMAESYYAGLLLQYPETYLLHGDLHHENILMDEQRGWLAIDPKGVTGPRVMECGRFLHNFIEDEIPGVEHVKDASEAQIARILKQRFEIFEEMLDFDYADIVKATYVDLVLSSCWSINSKARVDYTRIRVLARFLDNRVK